MSVRMSMAPATGIEDTIYYLKKNLIQLSYLYLLHTYCEWCHRLINMYFFLSQERTHVHSLFSFSLSTHTQDFNFYFSFDFHTKTVGTDKRSHSVWQVQTPVKAPLDFPNCQIREAIKGKRTGTGAWLRTHAIDFDPPWPLWNARGR